MPNPVCIKCMVEMEDEGATEACQMVRDIPCMIIWEVIHYKCPRCGYEILAEYGDKVGEANHKDDVSAEYWFQEE